MTSPDHTQVPAAPDEPAAQAPMDVPPGDQAPADGAAPTDGAPVDEGRRETEQTVRSISRLEERN